MPQGRYLLKSISESRKLSELKSDGARLLFSWLIPHLDYNGCFHGDPHLINNKVFSRLKKGDDIVAEHLQELQSVGLIVLYKAKGDTFLYVPTFVEKQPGLNADREAKTHIPPPTEAQLKEAVPIPVSIREQRHNEPKIKFEDGEWTGITEKHKERWRGAFPACDVEIELKQMAAWILANPKKGLKRNYHRFITAWLSRAQDKGGTRGVPGVAGSRPELAYLKGKK